MIPLNTNMSAPTFVETLNDNLNEAASSGGPSDGGGSGSTGAVRTIKMQMQGGVMEDGYTKWASGGATTVDNSFFYSCHTVLMLNIEGCTITSVTKDSSETLTIFCYGASGAYIESVTASNSVNALNSIPSSACFVKFMLTKSTAYTYLPVLSVTVAGNPTLVKNSTPSLVTTKYFSFETTYPSKIDSPTATDDYIGANNSTRYYDNGLIKLPPNYSTTGAPVPLVVFVHGTNGFDFFKGPKPLYDVQQSFVVNNGYALCDCSGITNDGAYYLSGDNSYDNTYFAPSFVSCIHSLVKFVTANYNVKDDGVYLISKSAGGYTLHLLTQVSGLKIKAAAALASAISPFGNMEYYLTGPSLRATTRALAQLGITGLTGTWSNDKTKVLNNVHNIRQIDPLFMGTDITDDEVKSLITRLYEGTNPSNGQRYYYNVDDCMNGFTDNGVAIPGLNSLSLRVIVPTKIWAPVSDANVSFDMEKLYVEMAQRAGSPCYLRKMNGKHHAVDTGDNDYALPTVTYQPKYSDTPVTIAVAYAELVDWFNRW